MSCSCFFLKYSDDDDDDDNDDADDDVRRSIFPAGLPAEFSFISTFRARKVLKRSWDVLRISDTSGRPQFSVTLNPQDRLVEFMIPDLEGGTQRIDFAGLNVSNVAESDGRVGLPDADALGFVLS